jgi:hypothetical protein
VLFASQTAHDSALRHDERLRGTGAARERAFRETLWQWVVDAKDVLPRALYELIMDHATRTDMLGCSLCFNGPLRQSILVEVSRWLDDAQQPAARVRWQALAASQNDPGM